MVSLACTRPGALTGAQQGPTPARRPRVATPIPARLRLSAARAEPAGKGGAGNDEPLDEVAAKLLENDPQVQERLARVADAAERLADLQRQSGQLEREMAAARAAGEEREAEIRREVGKKEEEATERLAEVEVARAEQRLREAELAVLEAQAAARVIEAGAAKDAERVESIKAALVAAAAGAAGSLPYILPQDGTGAEAVVDVLGTGAACFLFGVVWRYAVRRDLGNTQLKSGVVAAFGIVRGLGLVRGDAIDFLGGDAVAGVTASLVVAESLFAFFFAGAALEAAAKRGWLRLYGDAGTLAEGEGARE